MGKIKKLAERYYYIFCVVISEPIYFFVRKKIVLKMMDDWNNGSNNFAHFREHRLTKIINSALNTPYYRTLLKNKRLPNNPCLHDFPLIDKYDFKNNWNAHLSKYNLIPHTEKNTGGSTGQPFHFYVSLYNRQLEYIHQKFFYLRYGFKKTDLIYSFGGIKISKVLQSKNIFWKKKTKNFPFGSINFSAITLTEQNSIYYIEKILQDKPAFLRGYPSAITMVASSILKLKLNKRFYFMKGIMITSENIEEKQIMQISSAFNCPVLPQYGMTESSAFGFSKANDLIYYCSPYYGVTEILDSEGNHVSKGEIGEIVLTSLGNSYQPFIRYKTGDMAIYGGENNGFTILKKIIGRTQDYIVDIDGLKIMLVGLIFGSHTKVFEKIKIWQIIQEKPGSILIKILTEKGWTENDEIKTKKIFWCNNKINTTIIYTNDFTLTNAGKRKFVIQNIK